jgi:hypothetical protein
MTAFCRLCGEGEKNNAFIACNNCGSFACPKHYTWFRYSKNAFCTECFPIVTKDAANDLAESMGTLDSPECPNALNKIASFIREDQVLSRIRNNSREMDNLKMIRELMARLGPLLEEVERSIDSDKGAPVENPYIKQIRKTDDDDDIMVIHYKG